MLTAFTNATIYAGRKTITGKTLLIENGKIKELSDSIIVPSGAAVIDCSGKYISPGLLDLQIAGGGGYLFSSVPSDEALEAISRSIVKTGTTGFLTAIPTNSFEVYKKVLGTAAKSSDPAFLGLHFEGPYISMMRRGAHIKEFIKAPRLDEVKELLGEAGGSIRMMTMAPEVCSSEVVKCLRDNGIVVAAGHSNATYREAVQGFANGFQTTTHLFNAMSQIHHRDPGLPGATLMTDGVFASIIADGIHVDYSMLKLAKKLMGERLFLISDAVEENSTGAYLHVRRKDRFTLPDGTLSGSLLSMLSAVRNCVKNVGIPIDEALRMASTYPAILMNLNDRGRIEPGFRADLIVFDNEFILSGVFIGGESIKEL